MILIGSFLGKYILLLLLENFRIIMYSTFATFIKEQNLSIKHKITNQ